jgi:hypothetical protein
MTIVYTAYDAAAPQDSDAHDGYPLTAQTDIGARRQARKLAREKGFADLRITFRRESDGCCGAISV